MVIATGKLETGMELDADILVNGRILLPKGAIINEKHFRLFKMWGVNTVKIVSNEDQGENIPEAVLKKAAEDVDLRLTHWRHDHPLLPLFKKSLISVTAKIYQKEGW